MDSALVVELVGYLASGLVVLSLVMSSVLKLRVIGLIGATVFATYGVLIGSIPVLVTNASIMVVHSVHLVRLLRDRAADSYFEVVRWPVFGTYLPRFLEYHREDVTRSQPGFDGLRDDHLAWVVLRDAEPVGLVLATHDGSGHAHIDLDYVRPEHRDFRAGQVVYDEDRALAHDGIRRVSTIGQTPIHRRYLERMGFETVAGEPDTYTRAIAATPADTDRHSR